MTRIVRPVLGMVAAMAVLSLSFQFLPVTSQQKAGVAFLLEGMTYANDQGVIGYPTVLAAETTRTYCVNRKDDMQNCASSGGYAYQVKETINWSNGNSETVYGQWSCCGYGFC